MRSNGIQNLIEESRIKPSDIFTDREEPRTVFWDHFNAITARQRDILSVFALGVDDIKDRCRALSRTLATIDNRNAKGGGPESDVRDDSAVETEEEV